jgi:two-component system LytT family response regulator
MDQKIKSLILDDEENSLNLLKYYIGKYCPKIDIVATAKNKEEALSAIEKEHPTLLFLDVQLIGGTSFDLLEKLNLDAMKIIFVTAYDEYAVKAFKFNAIDYLMKPIDISELIAAVDKVVLDIQKENFSSYLRQINLTNPQPGLNPQDDIIAISSIESILFIKLEDILYLKAEKNYSIFFLNNKEQVVSTKGLNEFEKILEHHKKFIRIHHSYIVNVSHIFKVDKKGGYYCKFQNGDTIPVSKRKQSEFLKKIKI